MLSDDTEHLLMTAQAMAVSGGDTGAFQADMARRLKVWIAMAPAGAGPATLRACIKLCLGFSPKRSGVFSAGNGPAMRSAIIGAAYGADLARMKSLVEANTTITHTDPKAFHGALAVALMTAISAGGGPVEPGGFIKTLGSLLKDHDAQEFMELVNKAAASAKVGESVARYLISIGQPEGVGNYVLHTVPAVIQVWLRRPLDFREAVLEMVRAGGDTDTAASIIGGIIGAGVGEAGIPIQWIDGLMDWPRTADWMRGVGATLAQAVQSGKPVSPPELNIAAVLARNFFFTIIVLAHGFRRLAPPY
jgi:ADP-ribosylglycohydrolase